MKRIDLTTRDRAILERLHTRLLAWDEERSSIRFDMANVLARTSQPECCAACCMIGVIVSVENPDAFKNIVTNMNTTWQVSENWIRMHQECGALLGESDLGDGKSKFHALFYPEPCFYGASPGQTARVVRWVLDEGMIDWEGRVPELA